MSRLTRLTAALLLAVLGRSAAEEATTTAQKYFTDTELINQDGQPMRFYSDLIRGRVVVINTFFTTCTGICPPLSRRMAQIQERLGDRVGRDVHLMSISVDPTNDTPERLKAYARAYKAKAGWFFLAGSKENVDLVLRRLGQYAESPENHTGILLIGNDRTELWKKANALAPAEDVLRVVESVADDR